MDSQLTTFLHKFLDQSEYHLFKEYRYQTKYAFEYDEVILEAEIPSFHYLFAR